MKMPWDFSIKEIDLSTISELNNIKGIEKDKLLINSDDNTRLGIVSKEFSTFSHKEAVQQTIEAINEITKTNSRFKNFQINPDNVFFRNNKSFMKLDIDFTDLGFEIGKIRKVGDIVNFRTTIVNALDGTSRLKWKIGGLRLICLNGLMTFQEVDSLNFVHKSLDVPSISEAILNKFEIFQKFISDWKELSKKELTQEETKRLFEKLKKENEKKNKVAERNIDNIINLSEEVFEKEGRTLWTFYNLASNYTTHNEKVARSFNLQTQINRLFDDVVKAA